jgi:hypothetical protein
MSLVELEFTFKNSDTLLNKNIYLFIELWPSSTKTRKIQDPGSFIAALELEEQVCK